MNDRETIVWAHIKLHRAAAIENILREVLLKEIDIEAGIRLYQLAALPDNLDHYQPIADFYMRLGTIEKDLARPTKPVMRRDDSTIT